MASVRDQAATGAIAVHHHVQDAQSTDGTDAMLRAHQHAIEEAHSHGCDKGYSFSFSSEKDDGMYDAINRGWFKATADVNVIGHLNCDEQYLVGALDSVARYFRDRPAVDVLLADVIVVDHQFGYICHRRSLQPYAWLTQFCVSGSTAATFHRVEVTRERNLFFDVSWRNLGDKVWYNTLHRANVRFAVLNTPVSLFVVTGQNLNWTEEGLREKRRYEKEYLHGFTGGVQLVSWIYALRRLIKEWRLQPPREYQVYADDKNNRTSFPIPRPRGLWHKRWPQHPPPP